VGAIADGGAQDPACSVQEHRTIRRREGRRDPVDVATTCYMEEDPDQGVLDRQQSLIGPHARPTVGRY
jgi:hypothetical protein